MPLFKMLKFLVTSLSLMLYAFSVQGQQKTDETLWRETELILTSGDTIRGSSIFRFLDDVISIKGVDGSLQAYSAQNVVSFNVEGAEKNYALVKALGPINAYNLKRQYRTFLWNRDKDYGNFRSPAFFEVLLTGKYTLLQRENRSRQTSASPIPVTVQDSYSGKLMVQDVYADIETNFYLVNSENQIIPLRKPKKDIYKVFYMHERQIKAYVKKHGLRYKQVTDLARIIAYCNAI